MNCRSLVLAAFGVGALAVTARFGAGAAQDLKPHMLSGRALGTTVSLLALHRDAAQARSRWPKRSPRCRPWMR